VSDACRIAALLTLHDVAADPLAPNRQLLHGAARKVSAGGDDDLFTIAMQAIGQFGDARCFARAVDPGHQHDGRPIQGVIEAQMISRQ